MRQFFKQPLNSFLSFRGVGRGGVSMLALATLLLSGGLAALGQSEGSLTPRLDPEAERKPAVQRPLQAGIQHTENYNSEKHSLKAKTDAVRPLHSGISDSGKGFLGKLRSGARTASQLPLKSGASNGVLQSQATSGFGIIGVKFILANGNPPVINRVFAGTPAASVGMHPTDVIVAVDGVPTSGLSKEEVYDLIIGSPGTPVNVSIMHNGDFHVFTCVRMDINDITDPVVRRDYLTSM